MTSLVRCAAGAALTFLATAASAQQIGPSTKTEPYLLPTISGVSTTAILTAGDSVNGYRMVGIPDGFGTWEESARTFNLVSNHELGRGDGIVRADGSKGAFVSRWLIERGSLKVLSGRDHLTSPNDMHTWNGGAYVAGTTALERLCSADLANKNAYHLDGWTGTAERLFLSGEETAPPSTADQGRVFAHVVTGPEKNQSFELPRLGKIAFENAVANPFRQLKTIVMLDDDANRETNVTDPSKVCSTQGQTDCTEAPSELFMYVGTKQGAGRAIDKAGLTNGKLYGVRVKDGSRVVRGEDKVHVFGDTSPVTVAQFELYEFGNVANKSGTDIEKEAISNNVTQFIRIEDGAWDPRPGRERDYYFITTGRLTNDANTWLPSRLWRLRFSDITKPEAGGTIEMVLTNAFFSGQGSDPDADPTYQMIDNMTIDRLGRIILQEDTGNNPRLGRVYAYGIDTKKLVQVLVHNPKFFKTGGASFQTVDEESSGVVDATNVLGLGWYLLAVQNHKNLRATDPELAEGGQIVAVYVDPSITN